MLFITTLEGISSISHALTGEGDVRSCVIAITDSLNGRWFVVGTLTHYLCVSTCIRCTTLLQFYCILESRAALNNLEESTYGVFFFVSCGGAKPAQSSRNFFSCKMNPFNLRNGPG